MATLHVHGVPDELYERIRASAQAGNRSVSAEVVALLSEALAACETRRRQGEILAGIRRRRFTPPPGTPDSAELLREDRAR